MTGALQFLFLPRHPNFGAAGLFPIMPIELHDQARAVPALGLLDTGSSINVMPYDIRLQLGLDWAQQKFALRLGGVLAGVLTFAVQVKVTVGTFPTVELIFGWAQSNQVPLILGQTNFFDEFDVCLFRARGLFEVKPKS
jgi:hypothetical protein